MPLTADDILAGTGVGTAPLASITAGGPMPIVGSDAEAAQLLGATPQPSAPPQPLSGKTVRVVAPSGKVGDIPVENLSAAEAQGYKVETPAQATVREYLAENRGLSGSAKVALAQFADEALFGLPELVHDKTADPLEVAKWEALKKEHEAANVIGGVGGFAASLLAGGPLFKGASMAGRAAEGATAKLLAQRLAAAGAEKGVARTVAEKALVNAAKLGAESAVVAAPTAITEAALGDPDEAAETMLWSIGGGAALGGISPVAKGLFAKAAKGSVFAPGSIEGKLETFANDQAVKSLNPYGKIADRLAEVPGGVQEAGRVLREKGLFRRVGEGFEDLTARIGAEKEATGSGIGEIYKQLDDAGVTFDGSEIAKRLRREVLAPLEGKVGYEGRAAKVRRYIDSFEERHASGQAGEPTLVLDGFGGGTLVPGAAPSVKAGDLYNVRRDLDSLIYGERMPSPDQVDAQYKAIRGLFKNELDAKVKSALGDDVAAKLDRLNRDFQVLSIVEKGAQKNIGRDVRNRTNSLTDYLLSTGTAGVGSAAGGLIGGPAGALVGGGVSQLLGMFGNKYLRQNFNSLAVQGADKLGLLFAEQSMKRAAEELDRMPALFEGMAKGEARPEPVDALANFLGVHLPEHAGAQTRHDAYEAIATKLAEAVTNSAATSDRVGKMAGALAEGGAPKIGAALGEKQMQALSYLYETMPKAPPPRPFAPKTPWAPSPDALRVWGNRVEATLDPGSTLRRVADGTITPEHVATLEQLYPKLLRRIRGRIDDLSLQPNAPVLPYRIRSALRVLTGAKPENAVPPPPAPLPPPGPPPPASGSPPPSAGLTDVQRITG